MNQTYMKEKPILHFCFPCSANGDFNDGQLPL